MRAEPLTAYILTREDGSRFFSVTGDPRQAVVAGMPETWLDGIVKPGKKWGGRTVSDGAWRISIKIGVYGNLDVHGEGPKATAAPIWVEAAAHRFTAYQRALKAIEARASQQCAIVQQEMCWTASEDPAEAPVSKGHLAEVIAANSDKWKSHGRDFVGFMLRTMEGVTLREGPSRPDAAPA